MTFKITKSLARLQDTILRFPILLISISLIASFFSLNYISSNLGFDTDTTKILAEDLPFQQHRKRFIETFPQDDAAILIVIETSIAEQSSRLLDTLTQRFSAEKQCCSSVYTPGYGAFFDQQGLLYLDTNELQQVTEKLTDAQPFIGRLFEDNSLSSFISTLDMALTNQDYSLAIELDPILENVNTALVAVNDNKDYALSWQTLMFGLQNDHQTKQRFILVKPRLDFNNLLPAEQALLKIREIVQETQALFPDSSIRVTGEVALEHDELEGIAESTLIASLVSLFLVCCSIWIGLKSFKMMLATLFSLITGLIYTAAFATFAIGHLNLISVAFSVLYIGLAVDYAIHLCLRYRELLGQNHSSEQALRTSIHEVSPALALCALTTSAGFFAFVPTAYAGVSELGVIAGAGMFIALCISLTVLPALLTIFPSKPGYTDPNKSLLPNWFYRFPHQHQRAIRWTSLLLTAAGIGLLSQVSFDFNPVNLRDPNSESVATFKDLLRSKQASPLTLTVLAEDKNSALNTAQKLQNLASVKHAITLYDYLPEQQAQKLELLDDLSLVMGIEADHFPALQKPNLPQAVAALQSFQTSINKKLKQTTPADTTLMALNTQLSRFFEVLQASSSEQQIQLVNKLQSSLLQYLPDTMDLLLKGMKATTIDIDTLPEDLSQRWVSQQGIHRVMALPDKDLNDIDNLREFVLQIQSVAPTATDLPAIYLASGQEVVKAFQQALFGALFAILIILLIVQRSIKEALLTLLPLLIAAVLTGASTVLLSIPFNFANIIAVPLIFGLGVDSGIHIAHRLRHKKQGAELLLQTSTARAVFFSGLTTLFSFVSLAFTPHLGIASMGKLLAIAISLIVFCTLIVLPAFVRDDAIKT